MLLLKRNFGRQNLHILQSVHSVLHEQVFVDDGGTVRSRVTFKLSHGLLIDCLDKLRVHLRVHGGRLFCVAVFSFACLGA